MSTTPLSYYNSYAIDTKVDPAAVTNYGGLFPYLDLMHLTDLLGIVQRVCHPVSMMAWQPAEYVATLLALNLTGGDCVDDVPKLSVDPGIALYMGQISQTLGLKQRRMARGGTNILPSASSIREWLDKFHNPAEEKKRCRGVAFIPFQNSSLTNLKSAFLQFVTSAWQLHARSGHPPITKATLDLDATFMATQKKTSLPCYKHFDAYSALLVRWSETGLVLWDEFRDGNVPPCYRNKEALAESIAYLNHKIGISDVWVRSDSAAHQYELMELLTTWQANGRPSPVKFAIGCKKTAAFRAAVRQQKTEDWMPVYDKDGKLLYEVSEVVFVSSRDALTKSAPYRYLVSRRQIDQAKLPGLDEPIPEQADTEDKDIEMNMGGKTYKIFAIVSNIPDWTPLEIINWYNGRCGKGESVNSVIKSDLAGGQLPSSKFGANAAWWSIAVLAHNLHALLAALALPNNLKDARFKRLRFHFINVPARLLCHARTCVVRFFSEGALEIIQKIRGDLQALVPV